MVLHSLQTPSNLGILGYCYILFDFEFSIKQVKPEFLVFNLSL